MPDLLFVYGSLRSQFDNIHARRLRAESEFAGEGRVTGDLAQNGEFPGFRPGGEGMVQGEIYRLLDAEHTFNHLDVYEGDAYRRIRVNELSTGTSVWIYEFIVYEIIRP